MLYRPVTDNDSSLRTVIFKSCLSCTFRASATVLTLIITSFNRMTSNWSCQILWIGPALSGGLFRVVSSFQSCSM